MRGSRTLLGALAAMGALGNGPLPPVPAADTGSPAPVRCGGVVRSRRRRPRPRTVVTDVDSPARRSTGG
jgi:hypothetical protein